ncbi:chemotaxis protein methyltransferase CheR [Sphingomonas kyeonggiensis]|uniref:Chemotaxis protein methyltransferase n=2 Tax=Sphingomonas kyeonggiensis TaxID=1268553 RepID=A0A7W6JQC4_9SPHN|nr:chemotaxis protein methyltransferase CheR [Sphingomonas kyeonggiensis]
MATAATTLSAPSSGTDQMNRRNFAMLSSYIYDYSGIKMPESKKTMLEGRLRRRLRATGCRTLDEYCDYVFKGDHSADEGLHLINAVTTNKTDFFREPAHFDYLTETILPAFKASGMRTIRAWSAACSTGPEPYTVAMVLDDFADTQGGPSYGILATDLDTEVLAAARAGIYPVDLVEPVPADLQRKYVMRSLDPRRRDIRMTPELRSAIGFARLNLMDDRYPVGEAMHLIFCRNVLIYFDKPTQRKVVTRLVDCLAPGGYLFLGHSESITGLDLPLTQVANTVFKRS